MQESETGVLACSFTPSVASKPQRLVRPIDVSSEEWQEFLAAFPIPTEWDAVAVDRQFDLWRERRAYEDRQRRFREKSLAEEAARPPPPPTEAQRIAALETRVTALESSLPKPARIGRIPRHPSPPKAA